APPPPAAPRAALAVRPRVPPGAAGRPPGRRDHPGVLLTNPIRAERPARGLPPPASSRRTIPGSVDGPSPRAIPAPGLLYGRGLSRLSSRLAVRRPAPGRRHAVGPGPGRTGVRPGLT